MSDPLTITEPTPGGSQGVWSTLLNTALTAVLGRLNGHAEQHRRGGFDQVIPDISVLDYGAVGDGSTDDTTAIQSAATAACTAGARLVFPTGYTFMVNPQATNASGTSVALICLTAGIGVVIEQGTTVKVISSTTPFVAVFGADATTTDMSGLTYSGGGTIDGNSAARVAADVVPDTTTPCVGIGRTNKGSRIKVTDLRFTNFDSIWCVVFSSSGAGNMSDVEVSHCIFDNLGTATADDKHDFSCIYLDAIGMKVHHNEFWQGTRGAQTFTTNYGVRTAIELHGSAQDCHHNHTFGIQWGGNLWTSFNSWLETDFSDSKNAVGANWHDNSFNHCAVGVQIGAGANGGTNYGLSGVKVHHNEINFDPDLWNVNTGGGLEMSGVLVAHSTATGSLNDVTIDQNTIKITPNNTAMNSFTFDVTPQAVTSCISVNLLGTNATVPLDWRITNNTLIGSLQDAIHLYATAWKRLTVAKNKANDVHLVSGTGTGYVVLVQTPNSGASNVLYSVLICDNHYHDDQTSANKPYGYGSPNLSGMVYFAANSSADFQILDNSGFCENTGSVAVCQGNTSNVCSPGPLLRAQQCAATFSQPTGSYLRGSEILLVPQPSITAPTAAAYRQTAAQAGNGTGSTWQRQPIFSGVVSKTANYTALTGDIVLANTTTAGFTVTSPAAAAGASFTVKNVGSANSVTVSPASGTVDGSASATLAAGAKATYVSDGTNWFAVG